MNVPSAAVFAEATVRPSFTASTFMPLSAFSLGSIFPSVPPPPRTTSRQTVPVTFPATARAGTACRAPLTSDGLTPTSGSATGVPAETAASVVYEPFGPSVAEASPAPGRGCAPGNADVPAKVSCTDTHTALATPRSGSCSYTSRKMIPAASIEMAIGMKTTSLNAVPQRTRSVSTAKISPSAVATDGATTTQMTLFFRAVRMRSSVKTSP